MSELKKWLFQHKKRHYKVVYIAVGFMGNQYDAGIFEFDVSDSQLKKERLNAEQYGFYMNYKVLIKHFKLVNGRVSYISAMIN